MKGEKITAFSRFMLNFVIFGTSTIRSVLGRAPLFYSQALW